MVPEPRPPRPLPPSMAATLLTSDGWACVASALATDPVSLGRLATTCHEGRVASCDAMRGCDLTHMGVRALNQGELCAALNVTPEEARALPHVEEQRRGSMGYYTAHVFDLHDALPVLLHNLGGWDGLKARMDAHAARKRKRDDLDERRVAAARKRRATLDAWLAKTRPVGDAIGTVDEWTSSLKARGAKAPSGCAVLGPYLGDAALKTPSLKAAKEAVGAWEAAQTAELARHATLRAEMAATADERMAKLLEALTALGLVRRADSRLCDRYVAGDSDKTAAEVAVVMAQMKYIHEHLDPWQYNRAVEDRVYELSRGGRSFYQGINADARRLVHDAIDFPSAWPW